MYGDKFKRVFPPTPKTPTPTKCQEKETSISKFRVENNDEEFGVECNDEEFGEDNSRVDNLDSFSVSDDEVETKAKVDEEEPLQHIRPKCVNKKGNALFILYSSQKFMAILYFFIVGRKASPQDLYETDPAVVKIAINFLVKNGVVLSEKVFYEPACGNGSISKVLKEMGAGIVIERDLYTMDLKTNYLTVEDPNYDVLITNPPFCLKYEFSLKALQSKKSFVLLLPITILTTKKWIKMFSMEKIMVIFLTKCSFLHDGKWERKYDSCWVLGNVGIKENVFFYNDVE